MTPTQELLANKALSTLFQLRDEYVWRDDSDGAEQIDAIMERLEAFAKGSVAA